jgi:DnaK suppressor protein
MLVARLEELGVDLGSITVCSCPEATDAVCTSQAVELSTRLVDYNCHCIRQAREALERIRNGSYGVCIDCEEPMAENRLDAMAWAPLCRPCQEKAERTSLNGNARPSSQF